MTELKKCPFCGGKAKIVEDVWSDNEFCYVTCVDCNASTNACDTQDEAITKWNNRPSPWHTGTPTENGYYLVHMTIYDEEYDLCVDFKDGIWDDRKWGFGYNYKILAYQKIEPYKED